MRTYGKMRFISVLLLIVLAFSVAACAAADSGDKDKVQKRVLYISAYSYSWGSVPFQIKGLNEALTDEYIVNYEFMDTKNTAYSDGYKEFYNLLKYKIDTRSKYDAVFICDDAALNFVMLYKDELFSDIPVVFSGIDNVENGVAAAQADNVTGIVEVVDYSANMELAHQLIPDAKKLVLILDNMENGVGIAQQLKNSSAAFADYEVEYLNSSEYTHDELCRRLGALDSSEIVFCISMGQNKDGNVYSEEERYSIIREYVKVPMFRFTQSGVGSGLLGGYIVDHEASCRIAGGMLRQMIEQNITPEVELDTPGMYYFDYNIMARFGIKQSQLPAYVRDNCTILNEPESFLRLYAGRIIAGMAALLVVVLAALLVVRMRKNSQLAVKNGELAAAVADADKANQAKSQFLSRMSHEIRTPMNAIVGLTAIARRHRLEPAKVEDYLLKIDASSRVLLNIINDVLDMSAIESNKLKIASAEFDIKQLMSGIASIYYTQCRSKGVDFDVIADVTAESVIGDSLRTNQVLLNLVSNAYKFTPAGGSIRVSATQLSHTTDTTVVRFTVTDTGCGMSEDMLSRLFKPFEQESAQTAQKSGGSGLGMSIAKNLVTMMNGTIAVQSEKDKGTAFTVELPFGSAAGAAKAEDGCGLSAIILNDDETVRANTCALMERAGVKCDEAVSCDKALEMISARRAAGEKYDICVMDWPMRGIDCEAAVRSISAAGMDAENAIVAAAYDVGENEDAARAAGVTHFMTRPLFASTVKTMLAQLKGDAEQGGQDTESEYDFTGRRLLLAEDNELNFEIASELLEMVNMQLDHAENGQQAVDMFMNAEPGKYDMILMDVQMPVMDGYEATRRIRACGRKNARSIPILAMTANAFTSDVDNALASGMNGHIAKPIDTAILYSTIKRALDKQS